MSAFRRGNGWVSKFQYQNRQHWTPGGPWKKKEQAQEAERRYRDRLTARMTDETCASWAERWLEEFPRPEASTRRNYAYAMRRFAEDFGPTPLPDIERITARTWALGIPRNISRIVGIAYEDAHNFGIVESNPFSNLRLRRASAPAKCASRRWRTTERCSRRAPFSAATGRSSGR